MDKDIRFSEKKVDNSWKEAADHQHAAAAAADKQKKEPVQNENPEPYQSSEDINATKINFTSFITSLGMQTLIHLGEINNPMTKKKEMNIEAAHELIEIITLIEEKTKGNLAEDENKLVRSLLYDLRMRYISQTDKK